jgi:WD40 repeat protein
MKGFHSKAILSVDICVRKPLLVTCSEDTRIRLWNYVERKRELRYKQPDITPLSVAFHPSGLHVVVGCNDKIHIMNVYLKVLNKAQDIQVKQFKEVSFSHGGHFLAISHTNTLQIFNFYTMELAPSFPPIQGKIHIIEWFEDDTGIVTCDQSNNIAIYGIDSASNVSANVPMTKLNVTSLVKVPDTGNVYASCSNQTIQEITKDSPSKKLDLSGYPSQISMTHNQKLFFVGMGEPKMPGSVKYYKLPFTTGECMEMQAHSEEIKRMKVSSDDKYLFTVGKDGCVIIYEIKERERSDHVIEQLTK